LANGALPTPPNVTTCGLVGALSVKVSVAAEFPPVDGVNVTLTAQLLFGATVEPVQVSVVLAKLAAFVPASVTVEIVRLEFPELVIVSV
jgi:hypothetical protein